MKRSLTAAVAGLALLAMPPAFGWDDPSIAVEDIVIRAMSDAEIDALLSKLEETLREEAKNPPERGRSMAVYEFSSGIVARGLSNNRSISDEQVERMVKHLERLKAAFPQHESALDGAIFKAENLTIGREAPNIEGVDTDKVEFELEDYRGKVVVLDFWGDW